MGSSKNAPGKNAPGKMSPRKLPPRKLSPSRKIAPPPGKLPPINFFCEFFLISSFYFYDNFRP